MEGVHGSPFGPVIASMLGVVAWLVFILVFTLYWSSHYDLFQNIVVFFVSLVIVGLLIGVMWVSWGYKRFGRFGDWGD
jgi:hypothetical protein